MEGVSDLQVHEEVAAGAVDVAAIALEVYKANHAIWVYIVIIQTFSHLTYLTSICNSVKKPEVESLVRLSLYVI